jgi:hypothetical protein
MITLYIETNFLIGFAKNQDQESTKLVKMIEDSGFPKTDSIQDFYWEHLIFVNW